MLKYKYQNKLILILWCFYSNPNIRRHTRSAEVLGPWANSRFSSQPKPVRPRPHEVVQGPEKPLHVWLLSLSLAVSAILADKTFWSPVLSYPSQNIVSLSVFLFYSVIRRVVTLLNQIANTSANTGGLQAQMNHAVKAAEKIHEDNQILKKVRIWVFISIWCQGGVKNYLNCNFL